MKIFYVTNKKPRSHNRNGSNINYKTDIQTEFVQKYAHLYQGLPITQKTLQAHLVYIHQLRPGNIPDVDNLSKPIVDSFTGIMYRDDSLIIRRTADILALKDFDFVTVDSTDMPVEIYNDFNNFYLKNEPHILFYEVSEFSPSQIKIGEL